MFIDASVMGQLIRLSMFFTFTASPHVGFSYERRWVKPRKTVEIRLGAENAVRTINVPESDTELCHDVPVLPAKFSTTCAIESFLSRYRIIVGATMNLTRYSLVVSGIKNRIPQKRILE